MSGSRQSPIIISSGDDTASDTGNDGGDVEFVEVRGAPTDNSPDNTRKAERILRLAEYVNKLRRQQHLNNADANPKASLSRSKAAKRRLPDQREIESAQVCDKANIPRLRRGKRFRL